MKNQMLLMKSNPSFWVSTHVCALLLNAVAPERVFTRCMSSHPTFGQQVRRQLAQQAAITSEFVLLLRCFKAWAVDVRARRVEFQDRVAAVKAGLFRRSVLLARCFDSWAQFVDVPSMEPDADTSTIGATR